MVPRMDPEDANIASGSRKMKQQIVNMNFRSIQSSKMCPRGEFTCSDLKNKDFPGAETEAARWPHGNKMETKWKRVWKRSGKFWEGSRRSLG